MTFKYKVVRDLVPKELCERIYQHLLNKEGTSDTQVPNAQSFYGDPVLVALLEDLQPKIEEIVGEKLYRTYPYARIYNTGDELKKHTDRAECEISLSLAIGLDDPDIWTLYVDGEAIDLNQGDAAIYEGMEVEHWREPNPHGRSCNAFLHYVRQSTPGAEKMKNDGNRCN